MPRKTESVFAVEPTQATRWPGFLSALLLVAAGAAGLAFSQRDQLWKWTLRGPLDLSQLPREQQVKTLQQWGRDGEIESLVVQLAAQDGLIANAAFEVLRQSQTSWASERPTQLIDQQSRLVRALSEHWSAVPPSRDDWLHMLLDRAGDDLAFTADVPTRILATREQTIRAIEQRRNAGIAETNTPPTSDPSSETTPTLARVDGQPRLLHVPDGSPNEPSPGEATATSQWDTADSTTTDSPLLWELPERALIDVLADRNPSIAAGGAQELARRGVTPAELVWAKRLAGSSTDERIDLVAELKQAENVDRQRCLQWLADDLDRRVRSSAIESLLSDPTTVDRRWLESLLASETDAVLARQIESAMQNR